MKKNGCVANVFSGIISIFVAIFLFFITIIFCLTGFLPSLLQDLSLDFLLYFEGFVNSLVSLTEGLLSSFIEVSEFHYIIVGLLAAIILIFGIIYMIAGIKQVKVSRFSLEGYKSKKGLIVRYVIFELLFAGLLVASTVMNIIDVTIFALVILFNCMLKMFVCMLIAHSIRKGRNGTKVKLINSNEQTNYQYQPEVYTGPPATEEPKEQPQTDTLSAELSKLITLKVEGVITQEEYEARRVELERRYGTKTKFSG